MLIQNMQGTEFMQLLVILALLLYSGNANVQNILSEVKPMLESIGGEDMRRALESAEEISGVLSAVRALSAEAPKVEQPVKTANAEYFPLAPISQIADKDITYSLSKYISAQ